MSKTVEESHVGPKRVVYMCFSPDVLHSGHLSIIKKAAALGDELVLGALSDEAVASYKRYPLVPFEERKALLENLKGVSRVIEQKDVSYRDVVMQLKPDIVVHGDNWKDYQQPLRYELLELLNSYGGRLVEFPYASDERYRILEERSRIDLSLPDNRRGRLRKLINMKGTVNVMEAHDGLTGLIVENAKVAENGKIYQFDAMWVSSLCDSTVKGKPDIELVDMTSRFRTINDITEVTTKPIIFDGDTGGLIEHFVYTVKSLEKMGVSAVIIEDKKGLKKNSLFGTEVVQTQDDIAHFCKKIAAGKKAQKSADFMIIARIESLILDKGMEDALARAITFVEAGADGIMIHSRRKEPDEIIGFIERFRVKDKVTPLVIVPTSFNSVFEDEWKRRGVNIIIYANQLLRAAVPAMQETAEKILRHHRAQEADERLMPFKEIIRLIPEEI